MRNLRLDTLQKLYGRALSRMHAGLTHAHAPCQFSTGSATVNRSFSSPSFLRSSPIFTAPVQISTLLCKSSAVSMSPIVSCGPARMVMDRAENTQGEQAQFLKDPARLISSVETFIFDCDGVIWNGGKLLDGVKETVELLRSQGKQLYFLTNNSTKSRKQCLMKAEALGLNLREDEIFTSGFAATLYLKSIGFPANKKVYLIGEGGLPEEFDRAGISYIGGSEDNNKKPDSTPGSIMEHDQDVGAVVVGFDRCINYYKMQYAALCLRENPGCIFIATNCDEVVLLNGVQGQRWAGESAMVGAIQGSSGRIPIVVGKPATFMMDYLVMRFNITRDQICMVGDNLDTDILFGKNNGCKTLLVLTGVTDLKFLRSPENWIQPDYYTDHISDLLTGLRSPMLQSE